MQKFIKQFFKFAIPPVILLIAIEIYMHSIPNIYRYKTEWMQSHAAEVEMLVFGTSHTFNGIDPSRLSCCAFNLAIPNQLPEQDYFLLTKYAPLCPRLKTIIVDIEEANLVLPPLEQQGFNDRCSYYRIYMGYDKFSVLSPYNFEISSPRTCFYKARRYWNAKREGGGLIGCDSLGFSPLYVHKNDVGNANADYLNRQWENKEAVKRNLYYLDKIVRYCKAHGIRIVLISTPYRHTYYESLNPEMRQHVRLTGARFAKEPNVVYFDFQGDNRFNDNDFSDNSHLIEAGAIKFTTILNSLLMVGSKN